jgi:hypothetical protein
MRRSQEVKSWGDREMRERSSGDRKGLDQQTHAGGTGPTCQRMVSPFKDLRSELLDGNLDSARLASDVAQY